MERLVVQFSGMAACAVYCGHDVEQGSNAKVLSVSRSNHAWIAVSAGQVRKATVR